MSGHGALFDLRLLSVLAVWLERRGESAGRKNNESCAGGQFIVDRLTPDRALDKKGALFRVPSSMDCFMARLTTLPETRYNASSSSKLVAGTPTTYTKLDFKPAAGTCRLLFFG